MTSPSNNAISNKIPNILFLGPYPKQFGPSQRFRIEVYLPYLDKLDYRYSFVGFHTVEAYKKLYTKGSYFTKFFLITKGFIHRFLLLFSLKKYDFIFIQRETTPIGPPVFEWFIAKILKKKIIYDFDDAIWLPNYSEENALFHRLKSYWKVKYIIRWSHKVVVGNNFLLNYANKYNPNTLLIPTVVDTNHTHNPALYAQKENDILTIGWTGSLTTNKYIESLLPVFEKLNRKHTYKILLISNKRPDIHLENVTYIPWRLKDEIELLCQIDIGVMPLSTDHKFAEGKCGFKAIQYMALNIVTVVTPIGVNKEIVQHQVNGYHASTNEEWFEILDHLLQSDLDKKQKSSMARNTIINAYSVDSQKDSFIRLFQ